jgi:ADP-L-glycero-D-manno-heptose 6-epimerase
MKILLTGHRGFIGQHMLRALEQRGHQVDTYEWNTGNLPSIMEQDWVIHIGGISSTTERDIDKVLTQNYDFSRQIFNACKTYGVNLQYASSASIYGLGTDFVETAQPDPRTPYAWSKYLFERYHKRHQGGNTVQGFRYFNVYGPEGEEHKGSQASPYMQFKQQARDLGYIKLFEGSENYRRDFIHVSKVVETHIKFLEIPESGVWNLGTGRATSFRQVAETFNTKITEIPMPDVLKSSYQAYTCADVVFLQQTLEKYGFADSIA